MGLKTECLSMDFLEGEKKAAYLRSCNYTTTKPVKTSPEDNKELVRVSDVKL